MKIKTAELTGAALDWAVALCEGMVEPFSKQVEHDCWQPTTNWSQGGPIIEREHLSVEEEHPGQWYAQERYTKASVRGPTPLIAAMRAYVASKLGDMVEIPEEL